ncbi:MFS transporter [Embleya scabrispora]|uniref:MFS transporter n=1 Tax=Embleya scabrispora TaxID=159449 RepID=UPI00099E792A|nr:MFS transporter [Embleya scabrispora]MYS85767.1 MFS transporter [Streptomyces sp. SID5474]
MTRPACARALPRRVRWGYGGGEWANAVMWTAFSTLFLYYMTDVVGASAALGGTVVALGTVWNAVLQPYIGRRSDRLRSRHGRRLPFLTAAAIPYTVTSWLLFTDFGLTGIARAAYYTAVALAWFTSLTVFYVPYGALGAELSTDPTERTALSSVRTAFSQLGALVGAVTPLALHEVLGDALGGSDKAGWSAAAAVCALLATGGLLVTWATARGREPAAEPATVRPRDGMAMVRESRTVRLTLGMLAFGWAPLSVTGAVAVYYGIHVMGYSEDTASLVMLTWFAAGLAWLPLVRRMTDRFGKPRTYLLFTGCWAVVQCLFVFPGRGDDVLFWTLIMLSSAGSMAVAVTGWALLPDIADIESARTGERREGTLYGLAAFAQTALAAVVVWIAALALSFAGYGGGDHPDARARHAITVLMSLGTAMWMLPGMWCGWQIHNTVRAPQPQVGVLPDARTRLMRLE